MYMEERSQLSKGPDTSRTNNGGRTDRSMPRIANDEGHSNVPKRVVRLKPRKASIAGSGQVAARPAAAQQPAQA